MGKLFKDTSSYHAGEFKCITCDHSTIIFLDTKYDLFNLMESDQTCSHCEEEKDTLCDGDTILRYDWPNPHDKPWQPQCANLLEEDRYCIDCRDEVPIEADWRKLIVACSKCDSYMKFNE